MTEDKPDNVGDELTPEQVSESLSPLKCLDDQIGPPEGLAARTVAFVRRESALQAHSGLEVAAGRRNGTWHSRLDVAVAACLLILLAGLGFGAMNRMKLAQAQLACKNNLRQLFTDLSTYASLHDGQFPEFSNRRAGDFVDLLARNGFLSSKAVVTCPAVAASDAGITNQMDYAYPLGMRGDDGQIHGPSTKDIAMTTPLLADRPLSNWMPTAVNGNHPGGANILFLNGTVRFCRVPNVGFNGDHVFLNEDRQVAPGLHSRDAVLGMHDEHP